MPGKATTIFSCCAALTVGLASMAAVVSASSQDAQARVTGVVVQANVVASWGLNAYGELGDGTTADRSQPGDIRVGNDVVKVAAGLAHALAVRSDGTVWAWGLNGHGELGDGSMTDRSAPVQVAGLTGITQVAAGQEFSLALRSDGAAPERVTGLPAAVAGISAGYGFAVVLGADGSVWDWGTNEFGQLGVALESPVVTRPVHAIAAGSGITRLSAGYSHVLALKSDGTVLAWGDNESGQLGRGIITPTGGPAPVTALTSVMQVSAGWQSSYAVHTVPFLVGL
jgi:alpha-tubulin suppressor-like RCC1 family protein